MAHPIVKLVRPKHWMKNVLVFFPCVFSGGIFDLSAFPKALGAFGAMCLMSSAVYVVNDLFDLPDDRRHPTKAKRPIASGAVSVRAACVVLFLFASVSLALGFLVAGTSVSALLLTYLLVNVLYSWKLKALPIMDVGCIAFGFVLRIACGAAAVSVPVSPWLFLTIVSFSLYFALGKRKGELVGVGSVGRASLRARGGGIPNPS